jgi:acyl-CoA hydrolase
MPAAIAPMEIGRHLPERGLCWTSACSAESQVFREGLSGLNRPDLTFTGIFVPGLNRPSYLLETGAAVTTFFMLPEFSGSGRVEFLPLCYRDIRLWLAENPPQAALVMCAPPDADGRCSLGPVTDFLADIWERIPTLIAHVNREMPATLGTPGIPFERFDAVVDAPQALPEFDPGVDDTALRIARHAATVIPDGVTLQAGIGRVPEAVLRALTGKRGLAIHSGLIGDSALHLLRAGALRARNPITAGVAIGTKALYDAVSGPEFSFRPPSFTHDIATLAGIERFVAINSAIEVDLEGQAHAEATPGGFVSGPGGASDFAAGARRLDGLRIVVLPSTAAKGKISRIVHARDATGPVSLGRFDIDLVITEHGIADLRGKSHAARRTALIGIADPAHRDGLAAS